ncbi:MAG: succinate dehydrogenase cytochrome b subunit [Alistipes sp.]|nr:succinate dehydrogenase cytochrome b subunit [Alistipes sp.]
MGCFLTNSSLGRKLVMSISGCFLLLFITFHMAMNLVAIFSADAYNWICEMLGANWYALVGTAVLAGGVLVHFAYAFWLTWQNRKARGNVRYAVTVTEKGVSWASKNMLLLGVIVFLGLAMHLSHFWAKMQLVELMGGHEVVLTDGSVVAPTDGAAIIQYTFSQWYNVVLYLVWFAALWLHLTHGVWSMLQTVGWANDKWYPRLKCLSGIVATLIFGGFAIVVVWFYVQSLCGGCPCCA